MEPNPLAALNGILTDGLVFCTQAYAIFEQLRSAQDGASRLRLRTSQVEKRLVEEVLPICRYIQTYYRPGRYISVRWVDGGQTFDAELQQSGWYVDQGCYPKLMHLEITLAMHENEHVIWQHLSEGKGAFAPEGVIRNKREPAYSLPHVFRQDEHVALFVPIVVSQIAKKAEKPYPQGTSLVVQCHLNSLYTPAEWDVLVDNVKLQMPTNNFKEILMVNEVIDRASVLR